MTVGLEGLHLHQIARPQPLRTPRPLRVQPFSPNRHLPHARTHARTHAPTRITTTPLLTSQAGQPSPSTCWSTEAGRGKGQPRGRGTKGGRERDQRAHTAARATQGGGKGTGARRRPRIPLDKPGQPGWSTRALVEQHIDREGGKEQSAGATRRLRGQKVERSGRAIPRRAQADMVEGREVVKKVERSGRAIPAARRLMCTPCEAKVRGRGLDHPPAPPQKSRYKGRAGHSTLVCSATHTRWAKAKKGRGGWGGRGGGQGRNTRV